jgi:hypothetical protein
MGNDTARDRISGLADRAPRAAGGPWPVIGAFGSSLAILVLLARFAIDLLAPLSMGLLATRTVRDTFLDWLSGESHAGEPDPRWAACVVAASVTGTVVGVVWLFSTSPWARGTAAQRWVPPIVLELATAAEARGWGRRAVLHGGPILVPSARPAPVVAHGVPVHSGDRAGAGSALGRTDLDPDASTGTSGRAPSPSGGPAGSERIGLPTSTLISSSATVLREGERVDLNARVVAAAGQPAGMLVFRNGAVVVKSVTVDRHGRGTVTIGGLPAGSHTFTAEFVPSSAFLRSRSRGRVLLVRR